METTNGSRSDENMTFTIHQVAKMLGVVSATIRNWEKNGLIVAKRSASNYRVFTLDDIETLKRIKEYSIDKHMGTHAIKMLLPNSGGFHMENVVEQQKENYYSRGLISAKWKEIRETRGLTLEEVSREVGISLAHLSKLENGNANISLDFLNKLAHYYGENPLDFVEQPSAQSHLVKRGTGEQILIRDDPGIEMESLIAQKQHVMYPVLCTVEPGCGSKSQHTHNGEELIYVLAGTFAITIDDDPPYTVRTGDMFYFKGSERHMWRNISAKNGKLLWIHSAITKE